MLANAPAVDWKLQYHWNWAPWLTVLIVAGLIAWIIFCYRNEASPAKQFLRSLLVLLRLTTIAFILAMLSQLVFSGVRTGKPRLAILVDQSASMLTEDVADSVNMISRQDAAQQLINVNDRKLILALSENYLLELVSFDSEIRENTIQQESLFSNESPSENSPNHSRLGDALLYVMNKPSSAPLQGIITYSDGQITQGRTLSEATSQAKRKGIPLYFIGLGDDKPQPSLNLDSLLAEDQIYPGDIANFQASLNTSNLSGESIKVELLRNGKVVAEKTVVVSESDPTQSIPLQLIDRPPAEGNYKYSLRAKPIDPILAKKVESPSLQHPLIVKDQLLRVLIAAGYPNYEFRYLKHLLERDSSVQLTSFLQEADPDHPASDTTAIRQFPLTSEELNQFEVIILMDLDPSLLPRSLWGRLSNYVSQRGGGLAIIAGPRYLPHAYLDRPKFLAMLPTKPNSGLINGWNDEQGYQALKTDFGNQSANLLLSDSREKSESVWKNLPPFYWLANVGPAKPSAQVLTNHPNYMASATKSAPVFVTQYFGTGRVLLHAVDSTYRWRLKVGDVYFARYWGQTLRMLGKEKINSTKQNLLLATNENKYQVGEAVKIQLDGLVANEGKSPRIRLSKPGRADQEIALDAVGSKPGRWQVQLPGLPAGQYRVSLLTQQVEENPKSIDFEIEAPPGELTRIAMNREEMETAANTTRGRFYTFEEAKQLIDDLPPSRSVALENLPPYEIWNRWPFLLGICACLCAEWIIRKRQSML